MKLKEGQDFDNKKIKSLYIACLNNLAACHISRGNMIRAKGIIYIIINAYHNNLSLSLT